MKKENLLDCVIIGGGPAGLMAAIYLERFRCKIKLIDNGESRASLIPFSHNFPSYPEGISGKDILKKMYQQANQYSNCILYDTTLQLSYDASLQIFTVQNKNSQFYSKNIILATGVIDIEPQFSNLTSAIREGLIRHCIICDGFEVINKKIALIAKERKAVNEAFFLSNYTKKITILTLGSRLKLNEAEEAYFKLNGIKIIADSIEEIFIHPSKYITLEIQGINYPFDCIYSGLGIAARSDLAISLGAKHQKDKRLLTNIHQETNIPGLFAIGDVVLGLSQMTCGMSQAIYAATKIFRDKLKMKQEK